MNHHYFAATIYNWAVAPTREEAIAKVAGDIGQGIITRVQRTLPGVYCYSCRVGTDIKTPYEISFFVPQAVPVSDAEANYITDAEGNYIPVPADDIIHQVGNN